MCARNVQSSGALLICCSMVDYWIRAFSPHLMSQRVGLFLFIYYYIGVVNMCCLPVILS